MPSSYRIINYALRPAKAIERRMLCAAFERLYPFQRIERYRYVGFGSIYFSDFQLLHRELGITNMLSIEKDVEAEACFRFNRPYKCIRLKFATSTGVLPTLDWNKKTILWLDYDDRLNTSILGDIATTCLRASSGSLVVVSVNAQPDAGCGSVSPPAVDAHRDGALTRSRDGCATGIARSPRRLSFHSTENSEEPGNGVHLDTVLEFKPERCSSHHTLRWPAGVGQASRLSPANEFPFTFWRVPRNF